MAGRTRARAVVERYLEAYNERDVAEIEDVLAPEIESEGHRVDHDDLIAAVDDYWTAFPDCEHEVDRYVAAGDLVAVRTVFSGTHEGEYHGIGPTGESFAVTELMIFRVADGEIDGYWYAWDELGFWVQLGVLEHPLR